MLVNKINSKIRESMSGLRLKNCRGEPAFTNSPDVLSFFVEATI